MTLYEALELPEAQEKRDHYRRTKAEAEKFAQALATRSAGPPDPHVHPRLWQAEEDGMRSLLETLEAEADRLWDALFATPESQAFLDELADEALADLEAGRTEPLAPERL